MSTILDVAREAGVSAATVSRVLNNTGKISPATAKLVYAAVEKLGYEPNMQARGFRKGETQTILILVPNITNPYYAHIISGIIDTTRALGYNSFICNTGGEREQEIETLDMLARRRADGAILLGTDLGADWLRDYAERFPIVQCSEYDPDVDIPHVTIDNYAAAREATEYLIGLGHTRIGTVSSENNYLSTQLRLKGYRDALEAAGIPVEEDYIALAAVDYTFQSGKRAAKMLLSREKRPTALFCISDVLALGGIVGAQELGFNVPEDVTVLGFDDVEQTTIYRPNITTVAQPCYEIGRRGAELLYQCIGAHAETPRPRCESITLAHQLIERESTAQRNEFMGIRFPANGGASV